MTNLNPTSPLSAFLLTVLLTTNLNAIEPAAVVAGTARDYLACVSNPKDDAAWDRRLDERAEQAEKDSGEGLQSFATRAIQDRFFDKRGEMRKIEQASVADIVELCRYIVWADKRKLALPTSVAEPLYKEENIDKLTRLVAVIIRHVEYARKK